MQARLEVGLYITSLEAALLRQSVMLEDEIGLQQQQQQQQQGAEPDVSWPSAPLCSVLEVSVLPMCVPRSVGSCCPPAAILQELGHRLLPLSPPLTLPLPLPCFPQARTQLGSQSLGQTLWGVLAHNLSHWEVQRRPAAAAAQKGPAGSAGSAAPAVPAAASAAPTVTGGLSSPGATARLHCPASAASVLVCLQQAPARGLSDRGAEALMASDASRARGSSTEHQGACVAVEWHGWEGVQARSKVAACLNFKLMGVPTSGVGGHSTVHTVQARSKVAACVKGVPTGGGGGHSTVHPVSTSPGPGAMQTHRTHGVPHMRPGPAAAAAATLMVQSVDWYAPPLPVPQLPFLSLRRPGCLPWPSPGASAACCIAAARSF